VGSAGRASEKTPDQDPWTNDSTLPAGLEVAGGDTVSVSIETLEVNAHHKSRFIRKEKEP
jgi:hypothetical protein